MKGTICQEINYIEEACTLLVHIADNESFEQLQKSLEKKYGMETEDSRRRFGLLKDMEEAAIKALKKQMTDVEFYFKSRDDGFTLFKAVLLWDGTDDRFYHSLNEVREELDRLPKGDYCMRYSEVLQRYHLRLWDNTDLQEERKPIEIIRRILNMKVSNEEKLLLQDVFLEKEKHRNAVLELLEMSMKVLKGFEKELQREIQVFYEGCKNRFEKEDCAAYISKHLQISFDENPLGYEVRPLIIAVNNIALFCDPPNGENAGKQDIYRIGIIFSDENNILEAPVVEGPGRESQIQQALKVLSDKSKFEILAYIKDKKAYGSELAKYLNLSTATISHHMSALISCGLAEMEKVNNRVFYSGNRENLEDVLNYCRKVLIGEDESGEKR